jgi:metallo-beta-lactamase family protein
VLIVGYCAQGTLGQKLVDKPESVNIFHQEIKVRATIEVMSSMSAHADQPELLQFISNQHPDKLQKIFLVHGEIKKQEVYKAALLTKQYKSVEIPSLGEIFEL